MQNISATEATAGVQILADTALRRDEAFSRYETTPLNDSSDEECDSPSPILDTFYQSGGSASIVKMTNFNIRQFESIWTTFADFITSKFNVGRGRKSPFTSKDVLFIVITVLKHGGNWDLLGRVFKIKGPTFERLIMIFIRLITDEFYRQFVVQTMEHHSMTVSEEKAKNFSNFRYALYATDVTFQNTNRPSGNHEESKKYFSGKHKLYGCKVEVSVLPTGFAIDSTQYYPGSYSDIDIMHRNKTFHDTALRKCEGEGQMTDGGLYSEEFPEHWCLIADKGYQGQWNLCAPLHPTSVMPVEYCLSRRNLLTANYPRIGSSWRMILGVYARFGEWLGESIGGVKPIMIPFLGSV